MEQDGKTSRLQRISEKLDREAALELSAHTIINLQDHKTVANVLFEKGLFGQARSAALRLQIMRLQQREVFLSPVCERIGQRISETVLDVLDPDLRPPTDAQVKFALDIARELSVNLPGEALQYRGAMGEFIDRYQSLFYSRIHRKMV